MNVLSPKNQMISQALRNKVQFFQGKTQREMASLLSTMLRRPIHSQEVSYVIRNQDDLRNSLVPLRGPRASLLTNNAKTGPELELELEPEPETVLPNPVKKMNLVEQVKQLQEQVKRLQENETRLKAIEELLGIS